MADMDILFPLLMFLFSWGIWGLLALILWVWALVDIITSSFPNSTTKLIWIIVVIFLPFLGSILYLLIGKNQK